MEHQFDDLDDRQLLAAIDAALDVLTRDRLRLPTDRQRMDLLIGAIRVNARLHAYQTQLAARMDADESVWREHGTSVTSWLAESHRFTTREAGRLIAAGRQLARFETVAAAAERGEVLPKQAEAITSVLDDLPEDFDTNQLEQAQQMMVGFAQVHNSTELKTLTNALVEVLDPVSAEEREAKKVECEYRRARRNRHLSFSRHGDGSVSFRGSLPTCDAEPFVKIIDSYYAEIQRGLDSIDPEEAEYVTPATRRADALVTMVRKHAAEALAPSNGGDRPRAVITIDHAALQAAAVRAGYPLGRLLGSGEALPASVLRQWLCDAEIIPMVMGGPCEVLDVGRSRRLVTPEIRRALEVRDGGCVFPGCDKPPDACHAHHIRPWWAGGETSLGNLVLVCAHHHGIVEPGADPKADRWQVRIGSDHVPRVIPPRRVDPEQRPRTHSRFKTRRPTEQGAPTTSRPTRPPRQPAVSLPSARPKEWMTDRLRSVLPMRPLRNRCSVRGPDVMFGEARLVS